MAAATSAEPDDGFFTFAVSPSGAAAVTFDRPPVNAVSLRVYQDLSRLVDRIECNPNIRVVILRAPAGARAWCGGADLNDFVGSDVAARTTRYDFINSQLPRFYRMDRPVIAAIGGGGAIVSA